MFAKVFVTAAMAGLAATAAPVRKSVPSTWATNYLEDYNTYHVRYLALDCHLQHNTTFFEDCCHPLQANGTLADRASYCTPNATALAAASSKVAAQATATISATGAAASSDAAIESDLESEWCSATSSVESSATAAAVAASTTEAAAYVAQTSAASTEEYSYESSSASVEAASSSVAAYADYAQASTTEEAAAAATTTAEAKYQKAAASSSSSEDSWSSSTSSSAEAAATSSTSSSSSSGSGTTYSGEATYYYQTEGADASGEGSCGWTNTDSELIAAISTTDGSTWANTLCGKYAVVTNTANSKTVTVEIVDNCPSCNGADSLDLSPAAFQAIGDMDTGVLDITWQLQA
ncbi:uncharacterized protein EHS24_005499 [Apiotrichum porosum]|uniref:RlpA-like protein double-psi beta-barrel domain-containing protein n=1 Tax=Apiotrichum porosum TaxID=105984 RepID=A0A427XD21_9TREE|nr:uncharacterized protein EHS24_005499 [Apiotrichum porosum]RSH76614.1 hypothetical protein EHS24_005499 [Apiotrichum porosum]